MRVTFPCLQAKEVSLSKTEQAMETMKTVLDTRGEQLMQEREEQLLELLESENTEALEKDQYRSRITDSTKAKANAKGKDGDEDHEDLTEEERMEKLEREATAIGGE